MLFPLLLALLSGAPLLVGGQELTFSMSPDCSYAILMDGATWFESNVTGVRIGGVWKSSGAGGGLPLDAPPRAVNGTDAVLGPFSGWECSWGGGVMVTRALPLLSPSTALPGASGGVLFEQSFPSGLEGCASGAGAADSDDLATAFPTVTLPERAAGLAFASWSGSSDWPMPEAVGQWSSTGVLGGAFGFMGSIVAVVNGSLATALFTPINEFMTAHGAIAPSLGGGAYGLGYSGRVTSLPPGRLQRSLLVAGPRVNETVFAAGSALLALAGKPRPEVNAVVDLATSYLSYWTDNGAYYYYQTQPGENYQTTMLDAMSYERGALGLPIRTLQFDSWWYFKGPNQGVTSWEPQPSIFPSGMAPWPGIPLVLHNRMFQDVNAYSSNYSFIVDNSSHIAMPQDEALFTHIMGLARDWGMVEYEQDWLITVFRGVAAAQSDVFAADRWLDAMGDAATSLGLSIQYCMALPRFLLKSTQVRAVSNARASPDYAPGQSNWALGFPSILHWSLGLAPSKDVFWSTTFQQSPNCSSNSSSDSSSNGDAAQRSEPNTLLHALVATLTTGPVSIGDAIGCTNKTQTMMSYRAGDGLLLKSERPMTTLEAALRTGAAKAVAAIGANVSQPLDALYSTWNSHGPARAWRWHSVVAANLSSAYSLAPEDLGPAQAAAALGYVAFDWFCPLCAGKPLTEATPLLVAPGSAQPDAPANALSLRYFIVAPLLPSGHVLYGEAGKFAPMSGQRIRNFAPDADGFSLDLIVAPTGGEESITVLVSQPASPLTLAPVECAFAGKNGTATLVCTTAGGCSCA